jgi:hypothetical protein
VKRAILSTIAALVVLTVAWVLLTAGNATPTTWQALEERLPPAVQAADFRTIASQSEASDQVALPLGLRVRRLLRPEPHPLVVVGFPDSVQHYTVESVHSNVRLHCLVRYSSGKVARIVLRFPPAARQDANHPSRCVASSVSERYSHFA